MLWINFVKWKSQEITWTRWNSWIFIKKVQWPLQEIADVLNKSVQTANIAELAVVSRTVLIQKDISKGNIVGNYKLIAFLNHIWKLLTRIIAETLTI